ncbi:rhodanese-like domain-containing protein [Rickettsiaceae bacterium]|nr:rhodanese-like domain-containing protein [Rickettsiaceae bacterium]
MSQIKNIDANTLNQWLESNEAVLIDVREPEEFESAYIKQAKNIKLALIKYQDISLPEYAGKKIVMQCRSGFRSLLACQKIAEEQNELELYNLEGGILAWQQLGLQTQAMDLDDCY